MTFSRSQIVLLQAWFRRSALGSLPYTSRKAVTAEAARHVKQRSRAAPSPVPGSAPAQRFVTFGFPTSAAQAELFVAAVCPPSSVLWLDHPDSETARPTPSGGGLSSPCSQAGNRREAMDSFKAALERVFAGSGKFKTVAGTRLKGGAAL